MNLAKEDITEATKVEKLVDGAKVSPAARFTVNLKCVTIKWLLISLLNCRHLS